MDPSVRVLDRNVVPEARVDYVAVRTLQPLVLVPDPERASRGPELLERPRAPEVSVPPLPQQPADPRHGLVLEEDTVCAAVPVQHVRFSGARDVGHPRALGNVVVDLHVVRARAAGAVAEPEPAHVALLGGAR